MNNLIKIDGIIFSATDPEELKKEAIAYYTSRGLANPIVAVNERKELSLTLDVPDECPADVNKQLGWVKDLCIQNRFEKAISLLKAIVAQYPWCYSAYFNLACIEFWRDHIDKAEQLCREALRFKAEDRESLVLMGTILFSKKAYDQSLDFFLRVDEGASRDPLILTNVANCYRVLKKYNQAVEYYKRSTLENNVDLETYDALAHTYTECSKPQMAFEVAITGLKKSNDIVLADETVVSKLLSLAIDTATKISKTANNPHLVEQKLLELKKIDNRDVRFIEDEKIFDFLQLEYASIHNAKEHIIRYVPKVFYKDYALMHELIHLDFSIHTEQAGLLQKVVTTEEHYKTFLRDAGLFIPSGTSVPQYVYNETFRATFDAMKLQIVNSAIDLLIESKIYNYESIRPLQFLQLLSEVKNSVKTLSDNVKEDIPITKVNQICFVLVLVRTLHLKNTFGVDFLHHIKATPEQRNLAEKIYNMYKKCLDNYKPGDEFILLNDFAETLGATPYFSLVPVKLQMTTSADEYYAAANKRWSRQLWYFIDYLRSKFKREYPNKITYLAFDTFVAKENLEEFAKYIYRSSKPEDSPSLYLIKQVSTIPLLAAWRVAKDIVVIDDTVQKAIIASDIEKDVPTELLRIPAYCMYIAYNCVLAKGMESEGFFVLLDDVGFRSNTTPFLYFAFTYKEPDDKECDKLLAIFCQLPYSSLEKTVNHFKNVHEDYQKTFGLFSYINGQSYAACDRTHLVEIVRNAIKLTLYVCAEGLPTENGVRHSPIELKEPATSTIYKLGTELGAKLRGEQVSEDTASKGGTHKSPRPHMRRGHFRGCWMGSGNNKKLTLKWIAPTMVGAKG